MKRSVDDKSAPGVGVFDEGEAAERPLERLRYLTHDEAGLDLFALSGWFDEVSESIFQVGCEYLEGSLRHRGLSGRVHHGEGALRWLFEHVWCVGEVCGRLSLTLERRREVTHLAWEPLLCVGERLTPVGPGCTGRARAEVVVESLKGIGESVSASALERTLGELEAAIDGDCDASALRGWLRGMPEALEPFAAPLLSAQLTRLPSPVSVCSPWGGGHRWEFPLSPPLERLAGMTALLVVPRRVSPVVSWEAYAEGEKTTYEVATGCDTRAEAEAALRAMEKRRSPF